VKPINISTEFNLQRTKKQLARIRYKVVKMELDAVQIGCYGLEWMKNKNKKK
jgi:hypothetical protein